MRRILCIVLALILVASMVTVPAFASDSSDGSSSGGYRDGLKDYTWGENIVKYEIAPIFDILNGIWNEANAFAENVTDTIREEVQANVLDGIEFWKDVVDALSYDDYVSTLDSTTASSGISVTGFSATAAVSTNTSISFTYRIASGVFDYRDQLFCSTLKSLGIWDKVMITAINSSYLYGYCFLEDGSLVYGAFTNPIGQVNASLFGVYDIADLNPVCYSQGDSPRYRLYYSKAHAEAAAGDNFATSSLSAITFENVSEGTAGTYGYVLFECYRKSSTDTVWNADRAYKEFTWIPQSPYIASNTTLYVPDSSTVVLDTSHTINQPTGTTSTSRPVSFANSITNYNTYNFYGDDATVVNYYIGSTDDSGELTGIFNFGIFDEDTMIFTDPETGTEYQATGWSYDYTTRTYDIAFDAGTMTVNDTDITQVLLTYGDEALIIQYYDTSGNLIDTRSYVYLQVAQTGCAISGHSYTYETVKEATCTHAGERKYTCSICGDEYAEDIPMSEHTSTFSIFKEPTCTESGIGLYSCSTCGTEYTETIDALGHDWLEQETVDTTYSLPDGMSCPDCAGTEFSSELDEIAGIYVCICSGCGAEWEVDAVINYGETHYTCSVCGATRTESLDPDNGLFTAIGDLLADAVTWVTDKLSQLVDSLSGLNDTFQDYMEQIRESGGEYPAFLAAFVALLPEDLMAVLWFALIAVLVLAVWKKWFS